MARRLRRSRGRRPRCGRQLRRRRHLRSGHRDLGSGYGRWLISQRHPGPGRRHRCRTRIGIGRQAGGEREEEATTEVSKGQRPSPRRCRSRPGRQSEPSEPAGVVVGGPDGQAVGSPYHPMRAVLRPSLGQGLLHRLASPHDDGAVDRQLRPHRGGGRHARSRRTGATMGGGERRGDGSMGSSRLQLLLRCVPKNAIHLHHRPSIPRRTDEAAN